MFRKAAIFALGFLFMSPLYSQGPHISSGVRTLSAVRSFLATATFPRIRTVCPGTACDFTTPSAALTYVATQTRNADNQWIVIVMPATYAVTAQLVVPTYTKFVCNQNAGQYYGPCILTANTISTGSAIKLNAPYSSIVGFQINHQVTTLTGPTYTIEADGVGSTMVENLFIWSQANTTTFPFRVIYNNSAGNATGFEARGISLLYTSTGGTDGIGIYTGNAATDKTSVEGSIIQVIGGGSAVEMAGNANNSTRLLHSDVRVGGITQTGTGFLYVDAATFWTPTTVLTGRIEMLPNSLLTCRATAPTCARIGDEYCDTSAAKCWCDGTAWIKLGGAGTCE